MKRQFRKQPPQRFCSVKQSDLCFETAVIPYLKFTIDFKYNLSSFAAVAAGLYFNYDFAMNYKNPNYSKYNIHSFDFGIQVGTYLVGTRY